MSQSDDRDEMRDEYDFTGGVRGKYAAAYREGTNLVLLDSDVASVFRDAATVNQVLREYLAEHGAPPSERVPR
jgi:hypothetical protein